MSRAEEIEAGLSVVRRRVEQAATAAGRDPGAVTVVVVTKFFPASDVEILAGLGVTDVGENRHQEAEAKAAELADLDLRWHFIGSLQSNKATAVARYADVVESVDRAKLLTGLGRGADERGRTLECLVQVDLDGSPDGSSGVSSEGSPGGLRNPGRGGAAPDDVLALCEAIEGADGLRLRGLMAVAPLGADPAEAFARLAGLAEVVRRDHPDATWLSAGMSADLEQAVGAGATHVRVGSAVLGARPPVG
jgi:uncharacterized pyridoxal phosphate-containing UPF0001 family protein